MKIFMIKHERTERRTDPVRKGNREVPTIYDAFLSLKPERVLVLGGEKGLGSDSLLARARYAGEIRGASVTTLAYGDWYLTELMRDNEWDIADKSGFVLPTRAICGYDAAVLTRWGCDCCGMHDVADVQLFGNSTRVIAKVLDTLGERIGKNTYLLVSPELIGNVSESFLDRVVV